MLHSLRVLLFLAGSTMSISQAEYKLDKLAIVFSSELAANGAATTPDGRLFLVVQPRDGEQDPQVVEVRNGRAVPFPDATMNQWREGEDGARKFIGVNSIRVGPDGHLWAVDRGAPGIGKPLKTGGAKLVRIDLDTNSVDRTYDLTDVITARSFIDDVRFNGSSAYLSDAGQPGLVVLDLDSGRGRRVLDGHASTVSQKLLIAEHRPLTKPDGSPVVIHVDQLEVSPDGRWLYYQPCSGGMSRIETRYLRDAKISAEELAAHVEAFADTPSTGGTAIAANGTIYLSDVDNSRILTISPSGQVAQLVGDERLAWVDAMWIDNDGGLLMPSAQLNRTAGLNAGMNAVRPPLHLYRLALGAKPVAS